MQALQREGDPAGESCRVQDGAGWEEADAGDGEVEEKEQKRRSLWMSSCGEKSSVFKR